MKALILFFLFMTSKAYSLEYRAACTGNRGKVSVQMYSNKGRLYMQYSNATGADDFPLYEGVVTKLTLPIIKIAQDDLALLDYQVLVSWPLDQCKFNSKEPLIMDCNGIGQFHFPLNSNLSSTTLITSKVTEESLSNKYEIFKMRWGIDGPDFHHSLALPFDPSQCQARLK